MDLEFLNSVVANSGAILGSLIGLVGGIIGTWCSIRNSTTPAERAFVIRCSIGVWVLVMAFVIGLLLIPTPYNHLLWMPYVIILVVSILWMNRAQARLRDANKC
ncbi:MAG: hypothetical protein L0211_24840 [Planctomycetaceae bacterium]|nr:hypothetical protein [Planctomycetaceae bacterium]